MSRKIARKKTIYKFGSLRDKQLTISGAAFHLQFAVNRDAWIVK
jgi:hypothetical protein